MVGSERGKEAAGMMALHEALRNVCMNSDWTYSVFWTIRPRSRSRGGNGCKVGDDNGSLMLMWEDGFCRPGLATTDCLEDVHHGDDPVRKAFSKMSIQLYNYGEGLMGKVASDKCHKWVFKEPSECEPNVSNYWQSSFDAIPPEWTEQFASGIQTIAVIQAGYGLLQLGSSKIIAEDLHFVLRMRHTFESLGYQSGFYLSQLFSAVRNGSSPPSPNLTKTMTRPPPVFKWAQRPFQSAPPAPNFSNALRPSFPTTDETHLFLPHTHESPIEIVGDHDVDIKWPNGLSFFNALTGRAEDNGKLLSGSDSSICGWRELGVSEQRTNPMQRFGVGKSLNMSSNSITMVGAAAMDDQKMIVGRDSSGDAAANVSVSEYLSLEWHGSNTGDRLKKMENKFKRSFTMPARMDSSSAGNSYRRPVSDFRGLADTGMYSDVMETLLD